MIYLDYPSGGGDPFWQYVVILLPMSDSGPIPVDYGPLGLTVAQNGGPFDPLSAFEQNTSQVLFGNPTLEMHFAVPGNQANWRSDAISAPFNGVEDFCVEYCFYQDIRYNSTATPLQFRAIQLDGGGVPTGAGVACATYGIGTEYSFLSSAGISRVSGFPDDQWNFIAAQYLAATGRTYWYVGKLGDPSAPQIANYPAVLNTLHPGVRFDFCSNAGGLSAQAVQRSHLAQFRATRANRYGNNATAPIPTAPWPIGP